MPQLSPSTEERTDIKTTFLLCSSASGAGPVSHNFGKIFFIYIRAQQPPLPGAGDLKMDIPERQPPPNIGDCYLLSMQGDITQDCLLQVCKMLGWKVPYKPGLLVSHSQ